MWNATREFHPAATDNARMASVDAVAFRVAQLAGKTPIPSLLGAAHVDFANTLSHTRLHDAYAESTAAAKYPDLDTS